jgi:2-methylisocitrate lyase-like PEP mutase family enzyme
MTACDILAQRVTLLRNGAALQELGYVRVIWPGSFLRVGNKAQNGFMSRYAITTQPILAGIQTRTELYDTIGYSGSESLDNSISASVLPSQEPIRKDNSRHSNRRLSMA